MASIVSLPSLPVKVEKSVERVFVTLPVQPSNFVVVLLSIGVCIMIVSLIVSKPSGPFVVSKIVVRVLVVVPVHASYDVANSVLIGVTTS